MSEQSLQPIPPPTPNEFPNGNAKDGVAYQMANPANPLQQLVIMSMESYMQQGTIMQSLRSVAAEQDKQLKEIHGKLELYKTMAADAMSRLENLRKVRRAELRPEVESMFDFTKTNVETPSEK